MAKDYDPLLSTLRNTGTQILHGIFRTNFWYNEGILSDPDNEHLPQQNPRIRFSIGETNLGFISVTKEDVEDASPEGYATEVIFMVNIGTSGEKLLICLREDKTGLVDYAEKAVFGKFTAIMV